MPQMLKPKGPVLCYVVRHGVTVLNQDNRFRGNANPELAPEGVKEAENLAALFKDIPISHIFCSDKIRATKTAEIIAKAKGAPVHQTTSLRALDVGTFSGQKRTPESEASLQKYLDNPSSTIPGGESLCEFQARIRPCIEEAVDLCLKCGTPPILTAHSSVVHEIGAIARGNHKAVLVDPGGVLAVYFTNGKLDAEPIFKPTRAASKSQASTIT